MTHITIASQFSNFTDGRKSWMSVCTNAQQLMDELRNDEPLLFNSIVDGSYRLKPFVSLVIDNIPYADEEPWQEISLTPNSTVLIISAVAGG